MAKNTFKSKFSKKKDEKKVKISTSGKPDKVDFEPTHLVNEDLEYLLDGDFDLTEDILSILESADQELSILQEAPASISARLKKKQVLRRSRSRIRIGRKRAMRRRSDTKRIQRRARRQAVNNMKRKLSGGRKTSDLSYSERARIERLAARRKTAINRQAKRLVRVKRAQERKRLSSSFEPSGQMIRDDV